MVAPLQVTLSFAPDPTCRPQKAHKVDRRETSIDSKAAHPSFWKSFNGGSCFRLHRICSLDEFRDAADLREVSKSFAAVLFTGNIFFEYLLREVKANPLPILEAVGH